MKGKKFDIGKLRWDLLDLNLLNGAVGALTMGATKYSDKGYLTVPNRESRYKSAFMRHYTKFIKNSQEKDNESGLFHLDHAICNLIILREFLQEELDKSSTYVYNIYIGEGHETNRNSQP
jgi:hypothetical protein